MIFTILSSKYYYFVYKKEQVESGKVLSKSALNKLIKEVKTSNGGPIVISYEIKQDIADNLKKFVPTEEADLKGDVGDFGFIVIGDRERQVQEVLGKIRANFRLVDFKSNQSKKLNLGYGYSGNGVQTMECSASLMTIWILRLIMWTKWDFSNN